MTTQELLKSAWVFDPLTLLAVAGASVVYLKTESTSKRLTLFVAAAVLGLLALLSPIGVLAQGYSFSAHMLQHLILVLLVPPLLLLSLSASPRLSQVSKVLSPVLDRRPVGWMLGVSAMWIWHAPSLCNAATVSPLVHGAQTASLLAMGTAFWWPIVSPLEERRMAAPSGVLYLFSACIACTALGALIAFSPVEVCSAYSHPVDALGVLPLLRNTWGLSCAADQELGGLLMWVPACFVYAGAIFASLARWYGAEATEGARRLEGIS